MNDHDGHSHERGERWNDIENIPDPNMNILLAICICLTVFCVAAVIAKRASSYTPITVEAGQ